MKPPAGLQPAVLALLAVLPAPSAVALEASSLDEAVAAEVAGAVEVRHRIHAHPELGNREHETAALVAARLAELGLEVRTGVAHTGVVGVLSGGAGAGPVVAVRADMDALPVTERTDLPFRSTRRGSYLGQEVGIAHACGHDVHTAVLLGTAAALAAVQDELAGTVVFVFQPAEEGAPPGEEGGARLMLAEGALDHPRPEAIFALHAFPDLEVGELGWATGPTMAAVDQFAIEVRGRQSHGAYPHLSVDPVVTAAQVIEALQTIRSRNLDPAEPAVVSVGIVRGGERFNIIPETVHLEGTVRTYRGEAQDLVESRMREIVAGITAAAGAGSTVDYLRVTPATVNDDALARRMRPTLERVAGPGRLIEVAPTMAGEDFAFFADQIPGLYFRLGVTPPGETGHPLHTPSFVAADASVEVGMRAMAHLVVDFLSGGP